MNTHLTLVNNDSDAAQQVEENALIAHALAILDERYFKRGECLHSPGDVAAYLKLHLTPYPHEVFAMLCLDSKHRVLSYDELFFGSIDSASVYPREVVVRALANNAAAVIFVHFVARHKMAVMCPVFLCVRRRRHRRRSRISAQHQGT